MASVNFLFRSKKNIAPLTIRLLYSIRDEETSTSDNFTLSAKSQYLITKDEWKIYQGKAKNVSKIQMLQERTRINNELTPLNVAIIEAFEKSHDKTQLNNKWLQNVVDLFYKKPEKESIVPDDLISFIDYYIEKRKREVTNASITKYKVIKHKLEKIQKEVGRIFYLEELGSDFIEDFGEYYIENNYSANTRSKEYNIVKTFLRYSVFKGKKINESVLSHSFKKGEAKSIYLNFDEIEAINNTEFEDDYLINAKDWLVISCYLGQRISDFMRFDKSMIHIDDNKKYITFTQQKTTKEVTVPLHKNVIEILNKRNGNFPRAISDQRYNEYIKIVCEKAGINEIVEGKKQLDVSKEDEENSKIRNVLGKYPKWELVTSHIGRRSFASNYYGKIPTPYLINVTGHSSEKIFLDYVIVEANDLSKQLAQNEFFNQ